MNPLAMIAAAALHAMIATFGAWVVADFADREVRKVLMTERDDAFRIIEQGRAKVAAASTPACDAQVIKVAPAMCPEEKPITLTKTVVRPRSCPAPAKCTIVTALFSGFLE